MNTEQLLAFDVEIDSIHCIIFASTKAKARWQAVKAYREAGFGSRKDWPRPKATRAPRFDGSPLKKFGVAYSPSFIEDYPN